MQVKSKNKLVNFSKSKKIIILILLGLWIFLLFWKTIVHFEYTPKTFLLLFDLKRFMPIDIAYLGKHWLSTFKNYLLLLGFIVAAYGIGTWCLKEIFKLTCSRLEKFLYAMCLGCLALSMVIFFLGIVGAYKQNIFWIIYIVVVSMGGTITWLNRKELIPQSGWLLGKKFSLDYVLGIVLLLLISLALLTTNAPEIFFDCLVYHLAVPAQWVTAGGLQYLPSNFFSNFPMNIEMLYTGALLLGDERLARLWHLSLGILTALSIMAMGRSWFDRKTGFWAAGIFFSIPVVLLNMQVAGADVGATFFAILSIQAALTWVFRLPNKTQWLILSGVLAGTALGSKYNMIFVLGPSWLVIAILAYSNIKLRILSGG